MDIQRKAFESSNNVNPDWSFKFDEELQQYIALDSEMELQVDEFNEHWDTFRAGLEAKAQAVPKWVSVEDRLPPCDFEFCETGEHVSNVVLIHSAATCGFNMGMGHVNEDGVWNAYSGEHDFMNVLMVTHWMPLPDAPQEPAND